MLKKITILFLILFLVSCGKKETTQEIVKEEPIIETEVKEDIKYNDEMSFNQTWSFEGNGGYVSHKKNTYNKDIYIKDNNGTIIFNNLHLVANHNYIVFLSLFSDKDTNVKISIKNSNDEVLTSENFNINENNNQHTISFTYNQEEDWNNKIVIDFNSDASDYHVYIDYVFIKDLDIDNYSIKTNHLGYITNQIKQAVFPGNMGDAFYVINKDTNEIVYKELLGNAKIEEETGEYNSKGYFSELKSEGNYYLISEAGQQSQIFSIKDDIYNNVLKDALNFFYEQRCGSDINGYLPHAACHTGEAEVVGFGNKIDVIGGWHDAGDYGRYAKTGTEALANLLLAYYVNPQTFINNNLDILDECKYELDWLLKLQKDDGAIYNKVTTKVFADIVMPENDNKELYVLPAFTSSTASAAAVFGLGSIVFKGVNESYSKKLEEAALKSLNFIKNKKDNVYYVNPEGFSTGDYPTPSDKVQRCFAFCVGYILTHDKQYLNSALEQGIQTPFGENGEETLKYFGYYMLLKDNRLSKKEYDYCLGELNGVRSEAFRKIHENNYPYNGTSYPMGSNKVLLDRINICFLLNDINPNEIYRGTGEVSLSYIFGNNVLNRTFVTGYGRNYPHNMHHRQLKVTGIEIPGLLAPGPSKYINESNTSDYFSEEDAIARRYVDDFDAYYCNEPSILYNGPLVLALSFMSR